MELWTEITWDKEACIRCQVMAVIAVTIKTEVTIILPWWVGIMVGFDHWARGSVNTRTSFYHRRTYNAELGPAHCQGISVF